MIKHYFQTCLMNDFWGKHQPDFGSNRTKPRAKAAAIESFENASPFYKFVSRKHSVNFSVNEPAAL